MSGIGSRVLCAAFVLCTMQKPEVTQAVEAVPHLLLHTRTEQSQPAPRQPRERGWLGLSERGDMEIRSGTLRLVVAYNHPEDPDQHPEPTLPRLESERETISGISLELRLLF